MGETACWDKFLVHGSVSSYAQLVDDAATKLGNKVTGKSANRDRKPYGVGDVTDIRISVGVNRLKWDAPGGIFQGYQSRGDFSSRDDSFSLRTYERGPKRVSYPLRVLVSEKFVPFRGFPGGGYSFSEKSLRRGNRKQSHKKKETLLLISMLLPERILWK